MKGGGLLERDNKKGGEICWRRWFLRERALRMRAQQRGMLIRENVIVERGL